MISLSRNVSATVLLCLLVGCATPTPYQPEIAHSQVRGGYSDQQLAPDRYRVTFHGNSLTSRETVEAFLLYRAAELTVASGADWFAVIDRETDHTITREIRRDPLYDPWFGPAYGGWLPYWRYSVRGSGWRAWDPYHADPFWADRFDERQIEEFEATAEIRTGQGAPPTGAERAYDARAVIEAIGPRVRASNP